MMRILLVSYLLLDRSPQIDVINTLHKGVRSHAHSFQAAFHWHSARIQLVSCLLLQSQVKQFIGIHH